MGNLHITDIMTEAVAVLLSPSDMQYFTDSYVYVFTDTLPV